MAHHFHAVVCIDHAEAAIFEFAEGGVAGHQVAEDGVIEHHIRAAHDHGNIHHKAGAVGSGHAPDTKAFFAAVAEKLKPAHEILIIGHGTAKMDFATYLRSHETVLGTRIMGVETVDQPTKPQILAFARKFFAAKDLTTPQR